MKRLSHWPAAMLGLLAACGPPPSGVDVDVDVVDTETATGTEDVVPNISYATYRARAVPSSVRPGFIVEGDVYVPDEAALRRRYDAAVGTPGGLTASIVNGEHNVWPGFSAGELTYCIDGAFDTDNNPVTSVAAVRLALERAAEEWERLVNVDFIHLPEEDEDCHGANYDVVFNVALSNATNYNAAAFFPNYSRANRQLEITPSAFVPPPGGPTLQGIMAHELGHALGFRHEHIWLEEPCTMETSSYAELLTPYDVDSVMHYWWCRPSESGGYEVQPLDRTGAMSVYGLHPAYTTMFSYLL